MPWTIRHNARGSNQAKSAKAERDKPGAECESPAAAAPLQHPWWACFPRPAAVRVRTGSARDVHGTVELSGLIHRRRVWTQAQRVASPGAVTQLAGGEMTHQPKCEVLAAHHQQHRCDVVKPLVVACLPAGRDHCGGQHPRQLLPLAISRFCTPSSGEGPQGALHIHLHHLPRQGWRPSSMRVALLRAPTG